MEPRKPDRRAARTRAALQAALLALIAEKDYDAITVEELTARADLGRATFYLHYRDKDDLLLDYFTNFAAGQVEQFSQLPLSILSRSAGAESHGDAGVDDPPIRPILQVFRHAAENAPLYRIALRGGGTGRVAAELHRIVIAATDEMLRGKVRDEWQELDIQVDIELLVHVFVGAFLACLTWWLERGAPETPEEITRQFRLLIFPGMRQALGIWGQP
jgi:AcrR family transcriptional regulator